MFHCTKYFDNRNLILKLVRTNLNYHWTTPPFTKMYSSLYAPITLDECHSWFHFHRASPAASSTEQAKFLVHIGIRTHAWRRQSKITSPTSYRTSNISIVMNE